MRHEIINVILGGPGFAVGVQDSQLSRAPFDLHSRVERPALPTVCQPRAELLNCEVFLRLCNRPAPYTMQDKFMPYLVKLGQLLDSPRPLTSPIAWRSASVRSAFSGPRSTVLPFSLIIMGVPS